MLTIRIMALVALGLMFWGLATADPDTIERTAAVIVWCHMISKLLDIVFAKNTPTR